MSKINKDVELLVGDTTITSEDLYGTIDEVLSDLDVPTSSLPDKLVIQITEKLFQELVLKY